MPGRIIQRTHYRVDEVPTQGRERGLSVTAGRWVGVEVRPTRVFVWLGSRSQGHERVLPVGLEPRLLRSARRRRHLNIGTCHIAFLGNPALTLGLLGLNVARRAVSTARPDRGCPQPPGPEKG
jgi:hypothetical protein